jgi:GDP-4-dehydro-6-deoxy-D-mannose reductase
MDQLGQLYAVSYGMPVVVTRAFNHTGPGRGEQYAESSFAKQIAEVEVGKRESYNTAIWKRSENYTDVKDIVRGLHTSHRIYQSGVYNICSDQNKSMQEVMDTLKELAKTKIITTVNPALYRPYDFNFYAPQCNEFRELTDWEPEIELRQTLSDLLDYWRGKV